MIIDILTLFPRMFEGPLSESIIKIAREKRLVEINIYNIRDFADPPYYQVDDYAYGGGAGMILKVEPIDKLLKEILKDKRKTKKDIILMTPQGEPFTQELAHRLARKEYLIIICGHYKGIDERIHEFYKIDEISIGDYILSSGEVATLVMVDAIVRLLPGVIKDINSAWTDSFSDDLLDAPYYTRPEEFMGKRVPEVLLSGNHQKITEWRQKMREKLTKTRRPDLYEKYLKSIK